MSVTFLLAGTGNQLFQYATAPPEGRFSHLFLDDRVRRLTGLAGHPQLLRCPPAGRVVQGLALAGLALDLALHRLTGRTLITRLDLRRRKARPLIAEWVRAGYFQHDPQRRDVAALTAGLPAPEGAPLPVALHVRGGDMHAVHASADDPYGRLAPAYWAAALAGVAPGTPLHVFTDDAGHAARVMAPFAQTHPITYDTAPLERMLPRAVAACRFIACNSTLSYWILRLRGAGADSVAPAPFQRRADLALDPAISRLPAGYAP